MRMSSEKRICLTYEHLFAAHPTWYCSIPATGRSRIEVYKGIWSGAKPFHFALNQGARATPATLTWWTAAQKSIVPWKVTEWLGWPGWVEVVEVDVAWWCLVMPGGQICLFLSIFWCCMQPHLPQFMHMLEKRREITGLLQASCRKSRWRGWWDHCCDWFPAAMLCSWQLLEHH